VAELAPRRMDAHLAGRFLPREWLRPGRHGGQCLGVDGGLVCAPPRSRPGKGLLYARESPRRTTGTEPRPGTAADPHPPQGAQGRLASVLCQLLPALPPRRAVAGDDRHRDQSHRLPLRCAGRWHPDTGVGGGMSLSHFLTARRVPAFHALTCRSGFGRLAPYSGARSPRWPESVGPSGNRGGMTTITCRRCSRRALRWRDPGPASPGPTCPSACGRAAGGRRSAGRRRRVRWRAAPPSPGTRR
jgi:hypothetical protein